MLYHLASFLRDQYSALNVFRYITFRAMVAFVISLLLVLLIEPVFIKWFREKHLGQPIRDDGPQSHLSKKGTPTMGGLIIVASVVISTLLLADLLNPYIWLLLIVTLGYAALGFLDDYEKIVNKNPKGLSARTKFKWQFGIAGLIMCILVFLVPSYSTILIIPFFKNASIDLSYLYIPFGMLVIVGASNAVNLTDGLDGLVIGPTITVAIAYGVFSYVAGHAKIAEYLQIAYLPGTGDLSIAAAALVAGGLGFLWYNTYPAQVFMGDVGALSIGGALGLISVMVKQELLLVVAGGVFVVEALSVIIQVFYFKKTGKRIFRMAPIHHHFELKGMSEPKIIVRAWIISLVMSVLSIATLKLR